MTLAHALEHRHRIVIDAIDREHDEIGARQCRGEKALAVLDAAIVNDQLPARRCHQPLERSVRSRPSADIDDSSIRNPRVGAATRVGFVRLHRHRAFQRLRFGLHDPVQRVCFVKTLAQHARGLLLLDRPLLGHFTAARMQRQAPFAIFQFFSQAQHLRFEFGLRLARSTLRRLGRQVAHRVIAFRGHFLQSILLALDLVLERRVVFFERDEPPDIRAIRRTNQMRQHVQFTERHLPHFDRRLRMRHQRPVGRRDVAARARFVP